MAYGQNSDFGISIGLSTDDVAVANVFDGTVNDILSRKDEELGIMGTFMSLLGTYALIEQHNLLERQTDLNERMVDYSERYLELAEDNYTEITLDAYRAQRSLFDRFAASPFQDFEEEFLEMATERQEYTPDYALHEGRAVAGVGQQYTLLRQRRARQRRRYNAGLCCHENLMLDIAQANAVVDAQNRGFRYEDEKKMRLDEWYWQHISQAMQVVENMRANVITGLNGGVANATGAVSAISGVLSQGISAARGASAAIQDQASFFGTLSNGIFEAIGFGRGRGSVSGNYGPITTGMVGMRDLMSGGSAMASLSGMNVGGMASGYAPIQDNLSRALNNAINFGGQ